MYSSVFLSTKKWVLSTQQCQLHKLPKALNTTVVEVYAK